MLCTSSEKCLENRGGSVGEGVRRGWNGVGGVLILGRELEGWRSHLVEVFVKLSFFLEGTTVT